MANVRKICLKCFNCKRLYIQGVTKFYEHNLCWCDRNKKTVKGSESCDYWIYNSEFNKAERKEIQLRNSLRVIEEMQKNLSEIRQILKGD